MVFGFMKQTGGHINVYSEIGKGTCFRLYLPRASNAPGVTSRARPAAMPEPLGRETVLVVEDSEKLRRVVVRQISGLGYTVYEAEDGAAALEIVRQGIPIDLLFTDIVMPGEMSGADLATAASSLITGLKVLFTSGFPEARAETGGWLPGNSRLLAKPYRRDELARALRQALDG
jgi:CheY-like chemotaxis protein